MSKSHIEWTERTWNPVVGCSKVSAGCKYCYAETMARRLKAMGKPQYQRVVDDNGRWNGKLEFIPSAADIPVRRKKPSLYFVNSMSDLFHKDVSLDHDAISKLSFDYYLSLLCHSSGPINVVSKLSLPDASIF